MIISFNGDLAIKNAEIIRSRLLSALSSDVDSEAEDTSIRLDCSGAETVDLTFLQLIISARKTAAVLGRPFHLMAPANNVLHEALCRCGLLGSSDRAAWPEDQFWTIAEVSHE
jgi:anti-anti-sigma regulatory factor